MSKAEEKANEYAEKVMLSVNHRFDVREAYWDGYEQAEKELALTWEDVRKIVGLSEDVFEEGNNLSVQEFYEEVLERYLEAKK